MAAEGEGQTWQGLEGLRAFLERWLRRRCGDAAEVEDVVQETVVRAARYRSSLADPDRLRPWALRIARNVLADRLARDARRRGQRISSEALDLLPAPEEPTEALEDGYRLGNWILDRDEALRHLELALAGLEEEDRGLLRSFYAGTMSCRETAAELAISANLVKVRLFRARRKLERSIRQRVAIEGERRSGVRRAQDPATAATHGPPR